MGADAVATAVRRAVTEVAGILDVSETAPNKYTPRLEFELRLLTDRKGTDFSLWDLGGGAGILALAAAYLGIEATNVDDYLGLASTGSDVAVIDLLTSAGVHAIRHDLHGPIEIALGVDVVVSMHTIEHMHASPKLQYHKVAEALAPDGLFVIAAPNAVNLRKRVSAAFGTSSWSPMETWYEAPLFRGHVREPRVSDLVYIAHDLNLEPTIIGKNFIGEGYEGWRGRAARRLGPLLERRPALCSDIYLVAKKPSPFASASERN
jgi:SAM-dependent methyltransferase